MASAPRQWKGICEYPLTPEYEQGHELTFGTKADRYCGECGRLPAFCECQERGGIEGGK